MNNSLVPAFKWFLIIMTALIILFVVVSLMSMVIFPRNPEPVNYTFRECHGARFVMVTTDYNHPLTPEKIQALREEVIRNVLSSGGKSPSIRAEGGSGPGENGIGGYGYMIDEAGVPWEIRGGVGNRQSVTPRTYDRMNEWYSVHIDGNNAIQGNPMCTEVNGTVNTRPCG